MSDVVSMDAGDIAVGPEQLNEERSVHVLGNVGAQLKRHAAAAAAGGYKGLTKQQAQIKIDMLKGYWKTLMDTHLAVYAVGASAELDQILKDAEGAYEKAYEVLKEIEEGKGDEVGLRGGVCLELTNTWGTFDGNLKKWPGFRDRFTVAVHTNERVPPAFKFQHLIQSLRGQAAQAMGEWQLTESNYALAWERMLQMYNRKYLACHQLLREFEQLPVLRERGRAKDLRRMANVTHEVLRQLEAQGAPVKHWDIIVVYMLHSRLDAGTSRDWELHRAECADPEVPTAAEMMKFLEQQAAASERPVWGRGEEGGLGRSNVEDAGKLLDKDVRGLIRGGTGANRGGFRERMKGDKGCSCCGSERHQVWECQEFQMLSLAGRKDLVLRKGLCINCLKVGHHHDNCFQGPCGRCSGRPKHNSLLCPINAGVAEGNKSKRVKQEKGQNSLNKSNSKKYQNVFSIVIGEFLQMPTALVLLEIGNIEVGPVRALLDTGAQPNIISWKMVKEQRSECRAKGRMMLGIGGRPIEVRKVVTVRIKPWFPSGFSLQEEFWVMPRSWEWSLTLPACNRIMTHQVPGSKLGDPVTCIAREVDVLLGVGVLAKIIQGVGTPSADGVLRVDTALGAVFIGGDGGEQGTGAVNSAPLVECASDSLDRALRMLWEMDEVQGKGLQTEEEKEVEKLFVDTHKRDNEGRFIVTLPLKRNWRDLGSSKEIALRRFYMLEKRLEKDEEVRHKYVDFMREYEALGHMREVVKREEERDKVKYYIPHHCVMSKFRVVFDASCKTTSGLSLNDVQMLGEKLQRDLQEIVLRFRRHRVGIVADIKMMFRQIRITKEQWDLQRIFWRERSDEVLKEYWLTVNTYGMTSAAHNAVRAMVECARNLRGMYPQATKAIINDMYMDDCVTGADNLPMARALAIEMDRVLKSAGFDLRKWKSNYPQIFDALEREKIDEVLFEEEDKTKVLGLKWLIATDEFTYRVSAPKVEGKVTKRKVVSCVAQLYDPCGYVAPVSVIGKIMIQDLWKRGLGWDEVLPDELAIQWRRLWDGIGELERFRIPRWLGAESSDRVEFHGFSDASERAYGAVIYMRILEADGKGKVRLLTARSRVAPVKTVTIPRLELAAAELLSRMMRKIISVMEQEGAEYTLWTDSMISLHWIRKAPSSLKVFVANRVASIQENSRAERWRHVGTKDNPADLISRGLVAKDIVASKLWREGPPWLALQPACWPSNPIALEGLEAGRVEEKVVCAIGGYTGWLQVKVKGMAGSVDIIEYYGKLERLVRVLAYAFRFGERLRETGRKVMTRRVRSSRMETRLVPSNKEKERAMAYIIRKTQEQYWGKEVRLLEKGLQVQSGSKIEPLKPFLDREGVIRVGGRIGMADIGYDRRHPMIIPSGSRLAWMVMEMAHRETTHGGGQVMAQFIREKFWIPRLRSGLRSVVHRCVTCARHNAQTVQQLMADLPEDRVVPGKSFLVTGVDFAGPFRTKCGYAHGKVRGASKCWIAVFVCMKTRAVHLDIVTDLTTAAFIACFERFIARRGRCVRMYSDNGTTFKGAERELSVASKVWTGPGAIEHLGAKGTEWKFMTPAAPHQGGIYEAAVKSMKHHLVRVVGMRVLTYEQLLTLLSGIEAILNSRPLYPLTDDPADAQALTPGHFLVGEPLVLPLPFEMRQEKTDRGVERWKERKVILEHFWKVWKEEYLASLQQRKKWRREVEPVKVGQLVVLKSEVMPPAAWALGRISKVMPGKDGRVRTVEVQTAGGTFSRPVQKICLLPAGET